MNYIGTELTDNFSIRLTTYEQEMLLEIIPKEGKKIEKTEFELKVENTNLGLIIDQEYKLLEASQTMIVKKHDFTVAEIDKIESVGTQVGETSSYLGYGSEVAALASGLSSFDSSGFFITFSQSLKILSMFRFVSVYYGSVLEKFLAAGGEAMEPKSIVSEDLVIKNRVNSRRKITLYNKGITTVDTIHYKSILYFVSFVLRILEKIGLLYFSNKGKIHKATFYIIYVHNRLHFVLFNLFLSSGVLLNTRTLLHMKLWPDNTLMQIDKILALFCFFFYWLDIMEMLGTSLKFVRITSKEAEDERAK